MPHLKANQGTWKDQDCWGNCWVCSIYGEAKKRQAFSPSCHHYWSYSKTDMNLNAQPLRTNTTVRGSHPKTLLFHWNSEAVFQDFLHLAASSLTFCQALCWSQCMGECSAWDPGWEFPPRRGCHGALPQPFEEGSVCLPDVRLFDSKNPLLSSLENSWHFLHPTISDKKSFIEGKKGEKILQHLWKTVTIASW